LFCSALSCSCFLTTPLFPQPCTPTVSWGTRHPPFGPKVRRVLAKPSRFPRYGFFFSVFYLWFPFFFVFIFFFVRFVGESFSHLQADAPVCETILCRDRSVIVLPRFFPKFSPSSLARRCSTGGISFLFDDRFSTSRIRICTTMFFFSDSPARHIWSFAVVCIVAALFFLPTTIRHLLSAQMVPTVKPSSFVDSFLLLGDQ